VPCCTPLCCDAFTVIVAVSQENIIAEYRSVQSVPLLDLQKAYLDTVRSLPEYGAAFFFADVRLRCVGARCSQPLASCIVPHTSCTTSWCSSCRCVASQVGTAKRAKRWLPYTCRRGSARSHTRIGVGATARRRQSSSRSTHLASCCDPARRRTAASQARVTATHSLCRYDRGATAVDVAMYPLLLGHPHLILWWVWCLDVNRGTSTFVTDVGDQACTTVVLERQPVH
jgi:hypothetical protein